jgi:uncharacterized membrane protein YesL
MKFSIVAAALVLMVSLWLFPLMARYRNTVRGHVKNAILLAVGMFPRTLLALLVTLLVFGLPFLIPDLFVYVGWFWVCVGLSLPMYVTAFLFRRPLASEPAKQDGEGLKQD